MNSQSENTLICPTFSSYSSDHLVEIATKVSNEYKNVIGEENDDDTFEFALSIKQLDASIVNNSSIFPVFNRQLLNKFDETDKKIEKIDGDDSVLLVPLRNLLLQERKSPSSTSSSESDESESVPPYCVWRRKSIGSSPSSCKKSKSTGSILFKRFKICDLLRRSNSDGKDSYLFTTKTEKIAGRKSPRHSLEISGKATGKVKATPAMPASSAHELFYTKNRSIKEGDKRKSYLPYRKDLIGFFSVLGRASRT